MKVSLNHQKRPCQPVIGPQGTPVICLISGEYFFPNGGRRLPPLRGSMDLRGGCHRKALPFSLHPMQPLPMSSLHKYLDYSRTFPPFSGHTLLFLESQILPDPVDMAGNQSVNDLLALQLGCIRCDIDGRYLALTNHMQVRCFLAPVVYIVWFERRYNLGVKDVLY